MKVRNLWLIAATFFALLTSQNLLAASMKCGVHTIQDGGRPAIGKYEVYKKCGEPTVREGSTWVYDRKGAGRFILIFKDRGELSTINRGG